MPLKLRMHQFDGQATLVSDRKIPGLIGPPPPNGYLNILLLGDGYTKERRREWWKARTAIAARIFSSPPFNQEMQSVNIFSRFEPSSDYGIPVGSPGNTFFEMYQPDSTRTTLLLNRQFLFEYVSQLSFHKFGLQITGGDAWLNPSSKSFGCIGVVGPGAHAGSQSPPSSPDDDSAYPGGQISYFKAAHAMPEKLGHTFLHELGHALGLADEYERDESEKIDAHGFCVNPVYLYYPMAAPDPTSSEVIDISPIARNVARRWELLGESERLSDNMRFPLMSDDLTSVPPDFKWLDVMSKRDKEEFADRLYGHPSWHSDWNDCKADRTKFNAVQRWDEIHLVEGACLYRRNIYRPAFNCIMRSQFTQPDEEGFPIDTQFCKVCYHWIRMKILE